MSLNKSWFIIPNKIKKITGFKDAHVGFVQGLPEKFILEYTKKGAVVLDLFAGFGTTLFAASKLKRTGIGIEYDEKKVKYIKTSLKQPNKIIHSDSLKISSYKLPKIDLCFTSPPYMRYFDKENPLSNYTKAGNYKDYLNGMDKIYSEIKKLMKKDGYVIIEIDNTFDKTGKYPMTTLAWDVGKIISKYFFFERDFIYCTEKGKLSSKLVNNNNHHYCLVFKNV